MVVRKKFLEPLEIWMLVNRDDKDKGVAAMPLAVTVRARGPAGRLYQYLLKYSCVTGLSLCSHAFFQSLFTLGGPTCLRTRALQNSNSLFA